MIRNPDVLIPPPQPATPTPPDIGDTEGGPLITATSSGFKVGGQFEISGRFTGFQAGDLQIAHIAAVLRGSGYAGFGMVTMEGPGRELTISSPYGFGAEVKAADPVHMRASIMSGGLALSLYAGVEGGLVTHPKFKVASFSAVGQVELGIGAGTAMVEVFGPADRVAIQGAGGSAVLLMNPDS